MLDVIKNFDAVDASKVCGSVCPRSTTQVNSTAHFTKDLGLDSLNVVELMLAIEEEFCLDIPVDVSEKLHTVDDAINFVASHPQAK